MLKIDETTERRCSFTLGTIEVRGNQSPTTGWHLCAFRTARSAPLVSTHGTTLCEAFENLLCELSQIETELRHAAEATNASVDVLVREAFEVDRRCECNRAPEGVSHDCTTESVRMDTPDMHPTEEEAFGGKAGA